MSLPESDKHLTSSGAVSVTTHTHAHKPTYTDVRTLNVVTPGDIFVPVASLLRCLPAQKIIKRHADVRAAKDKQRARPLARMNIDGARTRSRMHTDGLPGTGPRQ